MKPNETVAVVQSMVAADPALGIAMNAAWNRICDKIEARALARRPKPKVFEVHHDLQVARLAFLEGVVAGCGVDAAEAESLAKVGL